MPIVWLLFLLCLPLPAKAACVTGTCHSRIAQIPLPHKPVQERECLSCHVRRQEAHPAGSGKSFALEPSGADLCYQCHARMDQFAVVHPPSREGECLSCHSPHGTAHRNLLDTDDDLSPLCFDCHDRGQFTQRHQHGPAAAGACAECHDPHQSAEPKLLTATGSALCLNCHTDFTEGLKNSTVVHAPVRDKPCTACHLPHASATPALLRESPPQLCRDCHIETAKGLERHRVKHAPLQEEGSCGNCHLTHYSNNKGLLPREESSVCFECHAGIRKELEKAKEKHGPVAAGECTPCHDPHGGEYRRLLTGRYPAGAYEPYETGDYDFCLQCHDKNLLRFRDTTIYTGFRDGDRNLHYLHVADPRKGRSCRFCHDPHGSTGPKLISGDGMRFGKWNVPIRFEITPTGGSCAPGCHRPLAYDRETPKNPPANPKKK